MCHSGPPVSRTELLSKMSVFLPLTLTEVERVIDKTL